MVREIIWLEKIEEKIEVKHGVTAYEVEEILDGKKKVRRMARGTSKVKMFTLLLGRP